MTVKSFEPKYMKLGVLTAALQELTPRAVRDKDPDRAIEDWLVFAREIGADNIQISAAVHPSESDVPPEAMLDPVANTLDLRAAVRRCARQAGPGGGQGGQGRHLRLRLLRQPPSPRPGSAQEEARVHAARVRRGRASWRRRRLRVRGAKPDAEHGSEPRAIYPGLHPSAQGGQGARPDLSRRAVPDARLDDGRQLAQQHRLHARCLDRAAPDLREARRRRPVPHSLRSVARHPHGAGHALDLPVPQGRGLRLPDRRFPRQGAGHRREGRVRPGATAARPWSAATGRTASRRRTRPIRSTPGSSRWRSPSTSCRAPPGTIRSRTCRTARSTGSTISSRRASSCRSTSRRRTSSSSTSTRGRASRTRSA